MAAPMESRVVRVFLDEGMNVFLDEDRSQPFVGPIYQQCGGDRNAYFLNEACTVNVEMVLPGHGTETERETGTENQGEESMEESRSSSASEMQSNDAFTREHTLFLIDLMRRHLEANGSELPHTLAELNIRIKHGKGSKKHMWGEMASQLSDHFGQAFDPARVNRKWNTLVDGYKKVKDNNRSTGRGTIRFKFFDEMDALLRANHDVEFPVIGTSEGIQIRRPDLVNDGGQVLAASPSPQGHIAPSTVSTSPNTVSTRRQRFRSQQSELVELLRESESASQRRHSELLAQMNRAQTSFEVLMREFLNKS